MLSSFSKKKKETCNDEKLPSYRLNGYITKDALNLLVEYAYTGQLEVPDELVISTLSKQLMSSSPLTLCLLLQIKSVYLAAWQLRMERVVSECAKHLIEDLSIETCIETRALPGINRNKNFVQEVDQFIAQNFAEMSQKSTEFLQLPSIQIEVLHQTKQEMAMIAEDSLSRLVLEWIKRQINDDSGSVSDRN